MKFHPACLLFPLLKDRDLERWERFVESIRERGLIDPIVVYNDGILDGRNRYLACLEAGVEPRYVQFAELKLTVEPHQYAFERNFQRRDLTSDQRAAIAAQFLELDSKVAAERQKHNLVP